MCPADPEIESFAADCSALVSSALTNGVIMLDEHQHLACLIQLGTLSGARILVFIRKISFGLELYMEVLVI